MFKCNWNAVHELEVTRYLYYLRLFPLLFVYSIFCFVLFDYLNQVSPATSNSRPNQGGNIPNMDLPTGKALPACVLNPGQGYTRYR